MFSSSLNLRKTKLPNQILSIKRKFSIKSRKEISEGYEQFILHAHVISYMILN